MAHQELNFADIITGQEHKLLGSTFSGQYVESNLPIEEGVNNPWIVPQGVFRGNAPLEAIVGARKEKGFIRSTVVRTQSDGSPLLITVHVLLAELDPITGETITDPLVDENEIEDICNQKEEIDQAMMTSMRLTADLYAFWGRDFDVFPRHSNRK